MTQTPSPRPQTAGTPPVTGSGGTIQSAVDQAQDTVGQVVDQVQQAAGQVTGQAKQQATSQLESQKSRAVDTLVSAAQALRQTGQHLHEQEQGTVAGYVEQAAEQVERATNYLRARDVPQLLGDTEDLARRQPGLFLGGALVLGFLGARFLMSSSQRAERQRALSAPTPTTGSYGGYGSGPYAPRPEHIPPGRDPAYRAPGPIGTTGPAPLSSTPGSTSGLASISDAASASGADAWRRPQAENA